MIKKWIYGTTALALILNPLSAVYGVGEHNLDEPLDALYIGLRSHLGKRDWNALKCVSKRCKKNVESAGEYNLDKPLDALYTGLQPHLNKKDWKVLKRVSKGCKKNVESIEKQITGKLLDLHQKATQKDPEACYKLGKDIYENEDEREKESDIERYEIALDYLKTAANKGHLEAKKYLEKISPPIVSGNSKSLEFSYEFRFLKDRDGPSSRITPETLEKGNLVFSKLKPPSSPAPTLSHQIQGNEVTAKPLWIRENLTKLLCPSLFKEEESFFSLVCKASEAELDIPFMVTHMRALLKSVPIGENEAGILDQALLPPRQLIRGPDDSIFPLEKIKEMFSYRQNDLEILEKSFPHLKKEIQQIKETYANYYEHLQAAPSEEERNRFTSIDKVCPLFSENQWPYKTSHQKAHSLLSVDLYGKSFKYKSGYQEAGTNAVYAGEGVHFKSAYPPNVLKPLQPQLEWAMYAFGQVLGFGDVAPPSCLLFLSHLPIYLCDRSTKEGEKADNHHEEAVRLKDVPTLKEELQKNFSYQEIIDIQEKLFPNEEVFFKNFFQNPLFQKQKGRDENHYREAIRPLPQNINLDELFNTPPYQKLKNLREMCVHVTSPSCKFTGSEFFERHYPELAPFRGKICPRYPISSETFFARYPEFKAYFKIAFMRNFTQASRTVEGISLHQFLEEKRSLLDINVESYGEQVLYTLLTLQTDVKDDNLIVDKENRIVNIDNDRTLAPFIAWDGDEHHIEAKNILFLIENLVMKPLHTKVKNTFSELDADETLLRWLGLCASKNQEYDTLQEKIDKDEKSRDLGKGADGQEDGSTKEYEKPDTAVKQIKFKAGAIAELRKRFIQIKDALEEGDITAQTLVEKVSPIAGAYYKKLRKECPNPHEAQHILWKKPPSCEQLLFDQPHLLKLLEKETAKRGEYENERTALPEEEAKKLIEAMDISPKSKSLEVKTKIFELIEAWLPDFSPWGSSRGLFNLACEFMSSDSSLSDKISLRDKMLERIFTHPEFNPHEVDEKDNKGNTLLHLWALRPSLGMTEEILKKWKGNTGNLDILNKEEKSPFDCALENNHTSLLESLLKQGGGKSYQEHLLEAYYHLVGKTSNHKLKDLFEKRKKTDPHFAWVLKRADFLLLPKLLPQGIGEKVEILTYNQGIIQKEERLLAPQLHPQLWDSKGNFIAFSTSKSRMVGRVILEENIIKSDPDELNQIKNHPRVYFTRFPFFPVMSIAVSLLQETLFREGFFPLNLAKIRGEPFLISPGIGRTQWDKKSKKWEEVDNLEYVLNHSIRPVDEIDADALMKSILMAILINPEDGHPGKYALDEVSPHKYRLIGINEERAFTPNNPIITNGFYILPKSILFCFNQLGHRLSAYPPLLSIIQSWQPEDLINQWTKALCEVQKKINKLFSKKEKEKFFKDKKTYLYIPFRNDEVTTLLEKLTKLQKLAKEATLEDIFKALAPGVYKEYSSILSKRASVVERFKDVYSHFYKQNLSFLKWVENSICSSAVPSAYLLEARGMLPIVRQSQKAGQRGTLNAAMVKKELETSPVKDKPSTKPSPSEKKVASKEAHEKEKNPQEKPRSVSQGNLQNPLPKKSPGGPLYYSAPELSEHNKPSLPISYGGSPLSTHSTVTTGGGFQSSSPRAMNDYSSGHKSPIPEGFAKKFNRFFEGGAFHDENEGK